MDKYSAVWISHSSIADFKHCPRAYYLKNVYKDKRTGHKISLVSSAMSLGSAIHQVLESLSTLPVKDRFKTPLATKLEQVWSQFKGKKGGFETQDIEAKYKQRALDILARVNQHRGPLEKLAVKIDMDLPHYWLSEDDGIILCGKLDWLEFIPQDNSVHIIDFKTGKHREEPDSLQLPIYHLLAHNCQTRPVSKVSYWYLSSDDTPTPQTLVDLEKASTLLLKIGKEIKLARSLERFKCPQGDTGCHYCRPLEKVIQGKAEFVGVGEYNQDLYLTPSSDSSPTSTLL